MCKPRTTYTLWQPDPPGLALYGNGLSMLTKLAGDGERRLALFHVIRKILLQMKFFYFKGCCTKLPFYWGSLLNIISSLFSHLRSWDYSEYFRIYSQLDRKGKTWFFIFHNMYDSWIERDKILISQLSPMV